MNKNDKKTSLFDRLDAVEEQLSDLDRIELKLRQMKVFAEQAVSESVSDHERKLLQKEMDELNEELKDLHQRVEKDFH